MYEKLTQITQTTCISDHETTQQQKSRTNKLPLPWGEAVNV